MCAGQTGTQQEKLNNVSIRHKLDKPDLTALMARPQFGDDTAYKKATEKAAKELPSRDLWLKGIMSQEELRRIADESKRQRIDSVVNTVNSTGAYLTKNIFEFYDTNLPKRRTEYKWDSQNKEWQTTSVYEYTWNEDGLCLTQSQWSDVYNSGQRKVYTYNEAKLGDSQTVYDYKDGQWIPLQKGTYVYDAKGRMTDEILHGWNETDFVPVVWTIVTYDEKDRQTSFYRKEWNGSEWQYSQDGEEYEYDDYGHMTLKKVNKYDRTTKTWGNYFRFEQTFNENNQVLSQENMFWNKDLESWVGVYDYGYGDCINSKVVYEYDDQGRILRESSSRRPRVEEYDLITEYVHTYSPIENGGTLALRETYDYSGDDKTLQGQLTRRLDNRDYMTYRHEKQLRNGIWQNLFEEKYRYDDEGKYLGLTYWTFTKGDENKKLADIKEEYTYDENGNVIETLHFRGQRTGEDDWVYSNRFTYAFEQDSILVEKLAYRWDGSDFTPNWGQGTVYDLSVPIEDVIVWVGWKSYHKISENRSYTSNNGGWDYESSKYYYSDPTASSIGNAVEEGAKPRLRQRVVTDMIEIIFDGDVKAKVYGMSGALLTASSDKQISVSSLPAGIYIVDVNGTKIKVVKR